MATEEKLIDEQAIAWTIRVRDAAFDDWMRLRLGWKRMRRTLRHLSA